MTELNWRSRRGVLLASVLTWAMTAGCTTIGTSRPIDLIAHANGTRVDHGDGRKPEVLTVESPVLDSSAQLHDYLAFAAFNNAGLEAAFNRWRAALERIPQVTSLPDPKFSYRYFIRQVETRAGPQVQGFGLSQTFPWLGKLELRGDAAAQNAQALRSQYEAAKLALFYEVTDAYSEFYFLGRAIEVVRENLELIAYLEGIARARYRTAAASQPDVIRAQVELGKLEDQLASLKDLRGPVIARLNAALNRPAGMELPTPSTVSSNRLVLQDDDVISLMERNNPTLQSLDARIRQAEIQIDLARKAYFPDLTLGVDYTDVDQAMRPHAPGFKNPGALRSITRINGGMGDLIDAYSIGKSFSRGSRSDDSGQDIWMVSLSMNIPIWHDSYAAGEREAHARRLAAMAERRQRTYDLSMQIKKALYEYRDAERKIELYKSTLIPKAQESIESTETAFRAGNATFLDLVDAERTLLDFALSYERALANRNSRFAELEKLVGSALPNEAATEQPTDTDETDKDD